MSRILPISTAVLAVGLLGAVLAAPVLAMPALPPATTNAGITTQTANASDAFPLLKGFLNMPSSERSQISLGYVVKVKHADASQVRIVLNDAGRNTSINIAGDGRVLPLPTREQLNNGAKVIISGPAQASVAMRLRVYSTQPRGTDYDAQGLATGIKQGNRGGSQIAGLLALAIPKLDRVYFVGGGEATAIMGNGQSQALPRTAGKGEYPSGTPYFVPSQVGGAIRIHLSAAPAAVLFDNPPK